MNHKYISAVAAFLILGVLLSATPLAYGVNVFAFGPKLEVVTIPQDNQKLAKGMIIIGAAPIPQSIGPTDLLSQHKIIVTYNGATLTWRVGDPGPTIACNVLEKDKIAVEPDPKTGDGKQGDYENLMTSLVDVSDKFVCKVRWTTIAAGGWLESVGVLDVYYVGPLGNEGKWWIADNILIVEAFFTVGRTVVFGSDIQDICVLGWGVEGSIDYSTPTIPQQWTKPNGDQHYVWMNAMGGWVSCEELALAERSALGLTIPAGQDPLAP